jgi:D-3-phosphoglycerate dehydrogenase
MGQDLAGEPPLVVLSERIGPLTTWERAIAERVSCRLVCRRLDDHRQIAVNAADAAVVIAGAVEPFDEPAFASLPGLRLLARRGVGVDNVDIAAASRHGVLVSHVPDASVEEVSDHALALLLSLYRRIHPAHRGVLRGRIDLARAAIDRTVPLSEATLGVVGAGRIGRRLVGKAGGVFGRVLVADPYVEAVAGAELVPLRRLLAEAHAVSLHAPLTAQTRGLVGADLLAATRAGVVLVNTARAGLVDEAALADAVRQGRVGGVGLDVSEDERPWRSLVDDGFDNLLLTGHTGARGARAQERLRGTCAAQVTDYLSGRMPAHVLNQEELT